MPHEIDIQIASAAPQLPTGEQLRIWVAAALSGRRDDATLTLRIVDNDEATRLNRRWRGVDAPTNVLSFPSEGIDDVAPGLLGDIVVCAPLVAIEAAAQGKPIDAHWAHMVVHGVLHLLGFDHLDAGDAREMESIERTILAQLDYADPYGAEAHV